MHSIYSSLSKENEETHQFLLGCYQSASKVFFFGFCHGWAVTNIFYLSGVNECHNEI